MEKVSRSQYYQQNLSGLTPQQRHQQLVYQALQQQPGGQPGLTALHATETDYDALRKHHRCVAGLACGYVFQSVMTSLSACAAWECGTVEALSCFITALELASTQQGPCLLRMCKHALELRGNMPALTW